MKIVKKLKFKTNINCNGCISSVTPFLNKNKDIEMWGVDLESSERVLTIESTNLDVDSIIKVVKKAGYKAEEL